MHSLTIVTVTYNSAAVIGSFLQALQSCGAKICVVDNGSSDETIDIVRRFPEVTLISSANIGYGNAANLGFRDIQTPYVLLSNPDVVITAEAIETLLAYAKVHPDIGILGARMFHRDGFGVKHYAKNYDATLSGLCEVDWVVGALMLMRLDALRQVGGFDRHIFLFFEETDLCKRFSRMGYKLAVCDGVEVEHTPGTSSPSSLRVIRIKAWHSAWSRAYFYRKHYDRKTYWIKTFFKLMTGLLRLLRSGLLLQKEAAVKNAYECLGTLAFIGGMSAYRGEVGRLT